MLEDRHAELVTRLRHHADLAAALRLLEWDQETYMPSGVIASRCRQIGALAALLHEYETAPAFLDLVDSLAGRITELTPQAVVDVRETKWRIDRVRRLDTALVRMRSELHAQARAVWVTAREQDDFATLSPYLARVIDVERRVAAAIDDRRDVYDVLLEEYEPGASAGALTAMFAELRDQLVALVARLQARLASRPLGTSALCGHFPLDDQRRFNRRVAEYLGFDFTHGRLDEAAHPFTTSIGNDVRLTTRYDETDLRYALYATMHETGHGLYEQGLEPSAWGTPRGTACSLGVHESQSRLWENQIGRSRAFWRALLPLAAELFPQLQQQSLDAILVSANEARPSLIRTEADEITYNLHIILRVELEMALVSGNLEPADLPEVWRTKMQTYLGIVPNDDRSGVLQDVHWASGAIGYFPTYTLGNIYAAQLLAAAARDLGPLDMLVQAGELRVLLRWLRDRVHRHGQSRRAPELVQAATGEPPSCDPLLQHLEEKIAFLESV